MRFLAALVLLAFVQDPEADKKKLGEIVKEMLQIQEKAEKDPAARADAALQKRFEELKKEGDVVIERLTGGDKTKEQALMEDVIAKVAPERAEAIRKARARALEVAAMAALKNFGTAQEVFRMDENSYWVGDVAGLHRRLRADGKPVDIVDAKFALADLKPLIPHDQEGETSAKVKYAKATGPAPAPGYRFAIVPSYEEDGKTLKYHDGNGLNPTRWAACAVPSEHGKTGTLTILVSERMVFWRKDTGGKPVEVLPADPEKDGWTK